MDRQTKYLCGQCVKSRRGVGGCRACSDNSAPQTGCRFPADRRPLPATYPLFKTLETAATGRIGPPGASWAFYCWASLEENENESGHLVGKQLLAPRFNCSTSAPVPLHHGPPFSPAEGTKFQKHTAHHRLTTNMFICSYTRNHEICLWDVELW